MSSDATSQLAEQTVDKLQDLIQANIDSVRGFREAAEQVADPTIASLFVTIAQERADLAGQLRQFVKENEERPVREGSLLAGLHRIWLDLRAKLNSGDPTVVLIEAERGEDSICDAYEEALQETGTSPVNRVLREQFRIVQSGHDQIRKLRELYQSRSVG